MSEIKDLEKKIAAFKGVFVRKFITQEREIMSEIKDLEKNMVKKAKYKAGQSVEYHENSSYPMSIQEKAHSIANKIDKMKSKKLVLFTLWNNRMENIVVEKLGEMSLEVTFPNGFEVVVRDSGDAAPAIAFATSFVSFVDGGMENPETIRKKMSFCKQEDSK